MAGDLQALYFQFGIKLNNVMDTQVDLTTWINFSTYIDLKILPSFFFIWQCMQIAYGIIEEQEGKRKGEVNDCVSFVGLLADPRYCGKCIHHVSISIPIAFS